MTWKIQLVDVNGRAVAKKVWISEPGTPRTLQEACLADLTKGNRGKKTSGPSNDSDNVAAVFNPANVDYSYMRYAASLGAGGDVCGWSDADRIPDLVYSRESSPASSTSSSSISTISSPTSSVSEWSSLPYDWNSSNTHQSILSHMCTLSSSNRPFHPPSRSNYSESASRSQSSAYTSGEDFSLQLAELQESFINPFTNQEYYEEI